MLFVFLGILVLAAAALWTWRYLQHLQLHRRRPDRYEKPPFDKRLAILYGAALLLLLAGILICCSPSNGDSEHPSDTTQTVPETQPPVLYKPGAVSQSDPANWKIDWEIFAGGQIADGYERTAPVSFGDSEDYFALPGIATFRGNNYRSSASYGTADVTGQTLAAVWEVETGVLPGTSWSGSGWTGQPLMVQWDRQTRSIMNLYEEKKNKEDLVEVIYATLDGNIYFLDLTDGSFTRDPLHIGLCFKGSGSLDPRGYPLLYVGAGDVNAYGKRPRMHIISLIDGSVLFEYGDNDPLSQRHDNDSWCAFDSAPLVDADTDTLIWPGENGILYTFALNTRYDAAAGTLSVAPDAPVVTRYRTERTGVKEYWCGYEASASIVENYLYISENGGMFYCIDLNTMELVWAQDTLDDSNASPVFERIGEDAGYIYTAPSLHWTKDHQNEGTVSVYKLDALTGQILWQTPYEVHTEEGVSGGVQSTPLLGKPGTDLEGMLIVSVARTPDRGTGILVALDTETGQELWRYTTDFYAWSSPTAVYTPEGKAYVLLGDTSGKLHLLDGSTGQALYTLTLNGNVEASPAIFNDMLVLGTREKKIYGIQIG